MRLGWRELDDLGHLAMPALIVHGAADRVLPVTHARALAAGIRSSELVIVDNMGHLPTRTEWIHLAGFVEAFLEHSAT